MCDSIFIHILCHENILQILGSKIINTSSGSMVNGTAMRQYSNRQKFLHLYHSYVSHSAGIEIVTYSNKYQTSAVVGGSADAQASSKDVSALFGRLDTTRAQSESAANPRNMDTEKRNNSAIVKKNMESEAATKIQASFRGYQVRKQLKNKVSKFCFLFCFV